MYIQLFPIVVIMMYIITTTTNYVSLYVFAFNYKCKHTSTFLRKHLYHTISVLSISALPATVVGIQPQQSFMEMQLTTCKVIYITCDGHT